MSVKPKTQKEIEAEQEFIVLSVINRFGPMSFDLIKLFVGHDDEDSSLSATVNRLIYKNHITTESQPFNDYHNLYRR